MNVLRSRGLPFATKVVLLGFEDLVEVGIQILGSLSDLSHPTFQAGLSGGDRLLLLVFLLQGRSLIVFTPPRRVDPGVQLLALLPALEDDRFAIALPQMVRLSCLPLLLKLLWLHFPSWQTRGSHLLLLLERALSERVSEDLVILIQLLVLGQDLDWLLLLGLLSLLRLGMPLTLRLWLLFPLLFGSFLFL